jgi:hypothetical protein
VLLDHVGGCDARAAAGDVGQHGAVLVLLELGPGQDGDGAVAVPLVDGEARALHGDVLVAGVAAVELLLGLGVVEPEDEIARAVGAHEVGVGAGVDLTADEKDRGQKEPLHRKSPSA